MRGTRHETEEEEEEAWEDLDQPAESRLQGKPQESTNVRQHAPKATVHHHRSTPLVHRLPVEILVEIFQMVPYNQQKRNATLMRVCSRWLNIISDVGVLWSSISIDIQDPMKARRLLVYMRICIERSKTAGLSITLRVKQLKVQYNIYTKIIRDISSFLPSGLEEYTESMFTLDHDLKAEPGYKPSLGHIVFIAVVMTLRGRNDGDAARWIRFSCHFSNDLWDPDEMDIMWGSLDCETPNLQHLHVSGRSSWDNNEAVLPNTRNIQSLRLEDATPPSTFYARVPKLRKLSYSLTTPSHSMMAMMAPGIPPFMALQHIRCDFPSGEWAGSQSFPTVYFPVLKSYELNGGSYELILPIIDAPMLERLGISDHNRPGQRDLSSFPIFQSVTRLQWYAYSLEGKLDARLLGLIPKFPQLERVYAWYSYNPELSVVVENTVAHLAREGQTTARFMSKEEIHAEPFQIPGLWE